MQLELKHLSPYLPYGLTGLWVNGKNRIYKVTNACVSGGGNISIGHSLKTRYKHEINRPLNEFKPLFIPLSELTSQMADDCGYISKDKFLEAIRLQAVPYLIWLDLVNNHNDVFDLIPNGLALNKLDYEN